MNGQAMGFRRAAVLGTILLLSVSRSPLPAQEPAGAPVDPAAAEAKRVADVIEAVRRAPDPADLQELVNWDGLPEPAKKTILGLLDAHLAVHPGLVRDADEAGTGWTRLHLAAFRGQTEIARLLLDHGADVHANVARAPRGDPKAPVRITPLHAATGLAHPPLYEAGRPNVPAMLALLAARGAKLDVPVQSGLAPHHGLTPLHGAARGGADAVKALLGRGADVNIRNTHEQTPLHFASSRAVAAALAERGADVRAADAEGVTPLQSAAFAPHADVADFLLEKGAPLDLASAVALERADRVADLLKADAAAVHRRSVWETTPLHWAARRGNAGIIEMLLAAGADANARDRMTNTPLLLAASSDAPAPAEAAARALLDGKADPNAAGFMGDTPLHAAVRGDRAALVALLLERQADSNARNEQGETPLMLTHGGPLAERLLAAGADPNRTDRHGATALHRAAHDNHAAFVKLLLARGADVNAKQDNGDTPLALAVFHLRKPATPEAIELLLQAGADVHALNSNGRTPLDLALNWIENPAVAELLRRHGAER